MTLVDVGQGGARIGAPKIRDLWDKGVRAQNTEGRRYWENLAFLQGSQWVQWGVSSNRLEEIPNSDDRTRIVANRMGATLRRLIAITMKREMVFEVPPTAADDATVRGAHISESILGDLHREQDWEGTREEMTIATLTGGTGLLCVDWDAGAGNPIEKDEETGRVLATGDCHLTALSVIEAVTEPGTKDIEKAQWWIKAQALPCKETQTLYGLKETPAADASTALSPIQRKVLSLDRESAPQDLCLVLTYYERPCPEYPDGQVCTVVGKDIVDGPYAWPFPFTDRLNVTEARETKVLNRWTGDTILSHAVPLQLAYNMVWSALVEHCKYAGNVRLRVPEFSGEEWDNLSDVPEVVRYTPVQGMPGPDWMAPPPLPPGHYQLMQELERTMDDILGVHDVTRGEAPRNIESGQGLSILAEQDTTPIGHVTYEITGAFERAASLILQCYAAKVKETRQARVDYPHQVSETVQWTGKDLMGQTRALIPHDAVRPITSAEIWTKGVNLWDRGFFNDQAGIPDRKAFARFIASGGEENFIEATDPDVAKQQRENYQMALGQPMEPAKFDEHQVHIEILNTFRKSANFERKMQIPVGGVNPKTGQPLTIGDLFELHAQAHSVLAAEEAAQAQNRMQQGGPELAAAPSPTGQIPRQLGAPETRQGRLSTAAYSDLRNQAQQALSPGQMQ